MVKRSENRLKSVSRKISMIIKKFSRWVLSSSKLLLVIKNFLICICSFTFVCFIHLIIQTKSPISDVFTSERISILKDRPANITRDIVIDMSSFLEKGGIRTLTINLIKGITKKRPNWRFLILTSKNCPHKYDYLPQSDNIKRIEIDITHLFFIFPQYALKNRLFGFLQDKLTQLIYYDTIFCDSSCDLIWDPRGDCSFCNFITVPRISTIHDLLCFDIPPEFSVSDMIRSKIQKNIENTIHFSKKIITVSEFSRKRICDKFHVSKDFVKHIPIALGSRLYLDNDFEKRSSVLNKYRLISKKYFIFCSTWWRHKNYLALMNAFNKFAEKNSDIKLILVGYHRGMFRSQPIQEFSSDRIIITGFVPDEELGILLKNALAFIHPSVYEGFGMPIIEAMANGIPVACSNVASLPEVAGSAALLFDPFNIDSITQAMHRLADDPLLRKDLIQKGYEQAKKYSDREAMVDEYIRVMEEVMRENDHPS